MKAGGLPDAAEGLCDSYGIRLQWLRGGWVETFLGDLSEVEFVEPRVGRCFKPPRYKISEGSVVTGEEALKEHRGERSRRGINLLKKLRNI